MNANEVIKKEADLLRGAVVDAIQRINDQTGLTVTDVDCRIDTLDELGGGTRSLVREVRITTET